jgi:cell division transport system ATP-binding protein
MSLLYCKNVTKIYNETLILDNVSFEIDNNEFVSLVGKSGVGKTTLLKLIIGEEKPTKGRIIFSGKDVTKMNCMELTMLRRKIGVVFQEFKLLSHKTAFENVAFVLESIGLSDEEIQEEVPEVLNLVGLKDKANNFPYQLSAGEKQRVAIARAIIQKPDLLLADEPTGNLDPINK